MTYPHPSLSAEIEMGNMMAASLASNHFRKSSNIIEIIACQMARVVPTREVFRPTLATVEMGDIYDGLSSLSIHDHVLARFLLDNS